MNQKQVKKLRKLCKQYATSYNAVDSTLVRSKNGVIQRRLNRNSTKFLVKQNKKVFKILCQMDKATYF